MQDLITAITRVLAMENGARLTVSPGIAYDPTDRELHIVAEALLRETRGSGVELLALRRQGDHLLACVSESGAEEPVCPAAFRRMLRRLSYVLLGRVWEGELLVVEPQNAPVPHLLAS